MNKQRVIFNTANQGNLTWNISVGVADTYSLTIKYHNPSAQPLKAKLEFLSADGTLMKTEIAEFAPTKEGKWNYLNTNTGSMINAGSYQLRLTATETKGLAVDVLDVQYFDIEHLPELSEDRILKSQIEILYNKVISGEVEAYFD